MTRLLAAALLFFALTSFAGAAVRETNGERMAKVPANDTTAAFLLNLLGAPTPSSLDLGLVAITCSPLRSGECLFNPLSSRQVVCCQHDNFDGVIATGCALQLG
ncbi:hypothetical protein C8F04DRAFT_1177733 [Mycena alexandri]|uniref:Hydrophobin n=1 Tax=Mycena alexandri TaxID=1745969 RepID=A0AAD6T800_9AGAR|nr:hypothetical protein C8F04DRAFT_1177733 [Mycena alexandri]